MPKRRSCAQVKMKNITYITLNFLHPQVSHRGLVKSVKYISAMRPQLMPPSLLYCNSTPSSLLSAWLHSAQSPPTRR